MYIHEVIGDWDEELESESETDEKSDFDEKSETRKNR